MSAPMLGGTRKRRIENDPLDSLDALLDDTRRQCRRLEDLMTSLLMRRRGQAEQACQHDPVLEYPSGPRDNGEYTMRCRFCRREL